ncbi:MAG: CRISPR-associated protein Cas5 [Synechococcus sp. YX04-3]|nr:MAG: CRISPR-associated protein Cas5 [Synechococcus sp. YX04-3]
MHLFGEGSKRRTVRVLPATLGLSQGLGRGEADSYVFPSPTALLGLYSAQRSHPSSRHAEPRAIEAPPHHQLCQCGAIQSQPSRSRLHRVTYGRISGRVIRCSSIEQIT